MKTKGHYISLSSSGIITDPRIIADTIFEDTFSTVEYQSDLFTDSLVSMSLEYQRSGNEEEAFIDGLTSNLSQLYLRYFHQATVKILPHGDLNSGIIIHVEYGDGEVSNTLSSRIFREGGVIKQVIEGETND